MEKLRELQFEDEPIILSERKTRDGDTMDILVPWVQADKKNQNDRFYPKALLQREVSRIQDAVESGAFVGTGDHPHGGAADVATSSHIVKKVWMDRRGKGWAEMKVIPTARGKNVMTLIRQGAQLGVSSRGFGNVDDKTGRVQDDYKLMGIDIVINPSYKEGVFNKENIFESLNFEPEEDIKAMEGGLDEISPPKGTTDKNIIVEEKEKIMDLKELREKYPELVKQIEDEKEAALKVESDKATEEKGTEITKLGEDIETLKGEKTALEEKNVALEGKVEKNVNFLREFISKAGEQEGVLEGEDDPEAEPKDESEVEKEAAEAKKSLADANVKIKTLEDKDQARVDTEKTEKEAAELQTSLEAALVEILEREEYANYAALIREDVTDEDGNIAIKSVEAVEDSVKSVFERISKIRSAEIKAAIIKDTDEKGRIPNPEGGGSEAEMKAKLISKFEMSVNAGFKGTFDEWKEKYPQIVESVTG